MRMKQPGGPQTSPKQPRRYADAPSVRGTAAVARDPQRGPPQRGRPCPNALKNVCEEDILSLVSLLQAQLRLIARIFADTGAKCLVLPLSALCRQARRPRHWWAVVPHGSSGGT